MRSGSTRRNFCRRLPLMLCFCGVSVAAGTKETKDDAKTYEPGGDITAPKLIHYVEPVYSDSSKNAYAEGTVRILLVVDPQGMPTDLHVTSGLNTEQDQAALKAVKQWRFQPGLRDGKPVRVRVTVEVDFHLL